MGGLLTTTNAGPEKTPEGGGFRHFWLNFGRRMFSSKPAIIFLRPTTPLDTFLADTVNERHLKRRLRSREG